MFRINSSLEQADLYASSTGCRRLRLLNNEARQGPFSGTPSLGSYIGESIGLRNLIHEDEDEDEAKTEDTKRGTAQTLYAN